ncbi:MAG: phosphodiester glycosidase family protein [Clostridia bacterium]|nr:phosphodiester glycosidase family protein [Clostridia bacterium]
MMKKTAVKLISIFAAAVLLAVTVTAAEVTLDGQVSTATEEIYPGVTATDYYLQSGYTYSGNGPQNLRVLEFDPRQEDLAFDVVMAGEVGSKKTVSHIVDDFNETNTENKTVVAAVNGDLWMMAQYHSRVEGSGTVCGGYSDAVVKAELCVPRGTNICDGEIISSQNMQQETPYEEVAESFGITPDGEPLIGNLRVKLFLTDVTSGTKGFYANGLNRLPANNAVVIYSDKGPTSNYCLDDAYEVVIDCDYDYTLTQNSTVTGTVTAISNPGDERPSMQPNRLIVTARGESYISKISSYAIGDEITLDVTLSDSYGNTEKWQNVTEAVGGHCVVLRDGEDVNPGANRADPMTLIGFKPDGKVVIIVNDGRQSWYSMGINRTLFDELGKDLGIDTMFLLDGGGSTTLVELAENGYELKNRPSDNATESTIGDERAVINAVLISAISEKAPEYTVTWKNGDSVIYEEVLEEGSVAVYDADTYGIPEKAEDGNYTYEFAGWDTAPGTVTADVTYNAVFDATEKYVTGDLDGDSKITAKDVNLLKKVITGAYEETLSADVNGDGKVTAADMNLLKRTVAGA